jgi:tetratricopeptide (TPR) repeat protein
MSSGASGGGDAWKVPVITETLSSKAHRKTSVDDTHNSEEMSPEEWLAWVKTLPDMDIEKELHGVKKEMGAYYSQGNYTAALDSAVKLEDVVRSTIGTDNAVYASCLNNVALMNKMLGHTALAMDKYTAALQLYEKTVGKGHASYVICNIGE